MEYISKEDVLGKLYLDHKDVTYIDKNAAAERIKKIQSIDIVRCKECKWRDDGNGANRALICTNEYIDIDCHPDFYCGYGEREDE